MNSTPAQGVPDSGADASAAVPLVVSFERLVDRATQGGLKSLDDDQVLELGRLWRRAGALLERARTGGLDKAEVAALNRLLARAYPLVHAAPRRRRGTGLWHFVAVEFPSSLRREFTAVLVATAFFLTGAVVGWVSMEMRPDGADLLFGPGWNESLDHVAERHMGNQDWLPEAIRPAASAKIITNNVKVSFLAFASGVVACVGSLWLMGFNGVLLGAVGAVVHRHGTDLAFWSFVAPHGVIEIPAILIAGGAGLVIGYALVAPGRLYRGAALRLAARRAIPLVMGVVLMLLVAGLIEGFISPRPDLPPEFKLGLALATFACVTAWLGLAGRTESEASSRPQAP